MSRSNFGSSFFGKAIPLNQAGAPLGRSMDVPPPGQPAPVSPARYAPVSPARYAPKVAGPVKTPGGTAQTPAPFKSAPAGFPPKHIPMGNKGDCPICH